MSFNQREGPQTSDDLGSSLRFETVKDYDDWLARLRSLPMALDQFTALLRQGMKERMVHPRIIMERIPAQIDKQIVSDPTQSGFYKPFKTFPPAISARPISSGSSRLHAKPWNSRLCRRLRSSNSSL